jgi:hypothetical protein
MVNCLTRVISSFLVLLSILTSATAQSPCESPGGLAAQIYVCTFSNGNNVALDIVSDDGTVVLSVSNLGNVAIEYFTICLEPGTCYTAVMSNAAGQTGWYNGYFWVNVNGVQVINESLDADLTTESAIFSLDGTCSGIPGCTDPLACNYDASANESDNSCIYADDCTTLYGCTNPAATNFDEEAIFDDGSCTYDGPGYCGGALPVECGSSYTGSTVGVTNDNATSGAAACSGSSSGGQHWYTFTATEMAIMNVNTCGSLFDTHLKVFTGSCGNLTCVGSNDDSGMNCNGIVNGNTLDSYVSFTAQAGITYYIRVGGFATQTGSYVLNVNCSTGEGCTDPSACNFDASAAEDDGSCEYASCAGCTDPSALNYNAEATVDDGSCSYCDSETGVLSSLYVCTFSNGNNVVLSITDSEGNEVITVSGLGNGAIDYFQVCLEPGECYIAAMSNAAGLTGWSNGYFWINSGGVQVINQSLDANLTAETDFFSIDGTCDGIPGCMDDTACNYNPEANVDDSSCIYAEDCLSLYGCTNPSASNYSADAIYDDGSCAFDGPQGCTGALEAICGNTYTGSTAGIPNDNASAGAASCGGSSTGGQHWYTLTMDEMTIVNVNTCGSMFDTYLRVYSGECGALDCVAYSDDAGMNCNGVPNGNSLDSYITFTAQPGVTYYIRVGGFASGSGQYTFNVNCSNGEGCTDTAACNYDSMATSDDGSCEYESCLGCTDISAMNYDPSATIDDGSCITCESEGGVNAQLYVCTFSNGNQVELDIFNSAGEVVISVSQLGNGSIDYFSLCLDPNECYTAVMSNNTDSLGWYNGYFWVNAEGVQLINESLDADLQEESVTFITGTGCDNDAITGCTDPLALNYNAEATEDDGSCEYDGEGGGGLPPFLLDFELENLEMKAFPVPAEDQISISVDRLTRPGNLRVRMFSSDGRLLRTFSQAHGEGAHRFSEDISELAPGFYLIELNGYWGARTLSIIKR